jgi:hypothetical protein
LKQNEEQTMQILKIFLVFKKVQMLHDESNPVNISKGSSNNKTSFVESEDEKEKELLLSNLLL